MTQRVGTTTANERDKDGTGPIEAYLMAHPSVGGRYVVGSGNKVEEAAAFLKDQGSGKHTLDDDVDEEDRKLYKLTGSSVVII